MNYNLVKKLKDAGFPKNSVRYHGQSVRYLMGFECAREALHLADEELYHPTLEELIDACGIQFDKLFYRPTGSNMQDEKGSWFAVKAYPLNYDPKEIRVPQSRGSTPSEAVANLWLALHSKN